MFKFWYFDIVEFGKLGPWSSSEDEHWLELWHMRVGLNMKSLQSFGVLYISGKLDKALGLSICKSNNFRKITKAERSLKCFKGK